MTEERIAKTEAAPSAKKLGIQKNQFAGIKDKDLRCRNIAVMVLNYTEDHGQDAGLLYASMNIKDSDEQHVREWVKKLAKERGMWKN